MPTCQRCHYKWSWGETMKRMFTLSTSMSCPNCKEKQYQTLKSRRKTGLLNMFIMLPLFLNIIFDFTGVILFSLFLLVALTVLFINPYLIQVENKEEFPF